MSATTHYENKLIVNSRLLLKSSFAKWHAAHNASKKVVLHFRAWRDYHDELQTKRNVKLIGAVARSNGKFSQIGVQEMARRSHSPL